MRKSIAVKTLLRAPLKTLLTFLLIAAASFALFSRVTDYAVTTRETARAESFYCGVAALDTSRPDFAGQIQEPKPWPTEEQLAEFASLPGVTLTDMRYMTDGLIEDYKRVIDPEASMTDGEFVMEGTYAGFEVSGSDNEYISFTDIQVYAGEVNPDPRFPMKLLAIRSSGNSSYYHSYSSEFFQELAEGTRCLVVGSYSEKTGSAFELGYVMSSFLDPGQEMLRIIDGLEEGYLDTEEFAWYKGKIEAVKQSIQTYDIVYTSDMRAIPYVNEHRLVISEGRPLTEGDTDACVVSELFLETYGLAVGDRIHVKLGDELQERYGTGSSRPNMVGDLSEFIASAELEIIGVYQFADSASERYFDNIDWSYGPATVFVPSSLLPVEIPADYEPQMGDFSVFVEHPQEIEAFRDAAEQLAAELGLALRFSDGGWLGMKDSFVTAPLTSFLTTVLYVAGAMLALLLAVYLYMARNKSTYAILRTLGAASVKAGRSIAIPLWILFVAAMAAGGTAGIFYASYMAAKTLAGIADSSAPDGYVYVLNAAIPAGAVIFCMVLELAFTSLFLALFLRKMKNTSPLELMQEDSGYMGRNPFLPDRMFHRRTDEAMQSEGGSFHSAGRFRRSRGIDSPQTVQKICTAETDCAMQSMDMAANHDALRGNAAAGIDMEKLSAAGRLSAYRKYGHYGTLRQTCTYIMRHMRRSTGKTAVSLILTVVLAAGLGMFVLARLAYQDAYNGLHIKGVATGFSSSAMTELSRSDLVKDLYYYANYEVRVNGEGVLSPITFSNDFERFLEGGCTIAYADGYDASVFERTGAVCLVGQALAKELGVRPGDTITLMSDDLYSFMVQLHEDDGSDFSFYEDAGSFLSALERAGKPYKVAGILTSGNEAASSGIFSAANYAAENLYSQPFEIGYCEYTLADNRKLAELNGLLETQKSQGMRYAPMASFHIDTEPFEQIKRIRRLLESLFPIAVAAAVLIGLFGPGLVIMQSAQEAAFLRILGVSRKRTRRTLVLEQVILCIAGIALSAGTLALIGQGRFVRSVETLGFCWALYFLGYICGAAASAVQVTRYKLLELLQVKE